MIARLWSRPVAQPVCPPFAKSAKKSGAKGAERATRKPTLERLEDRHLMAASNWVYPGLDDHLIYKPDAVGDRIPDFSNVGYQAGLAPIPVVPTVLTLSPQEGDDGAAIQNAINTVSMLPMDENGIRGAVLLTRGEYQIAGSLGLWASGVVLRGEGDGPDGTILRATGKDRRTLVTVWGGGSAKEVAGTRHTITDKLVPVGARSFHVDSTAGLAVGDTVIVDRPSSSAWIKAVGANKLKPAWKAGSKNLPSDRVITRIEGNLVTLDAPLTNAIEAQYGRGTIYKYAWPERIQNVGIESIRGQSDFTSPTDENHSWTFIGIGTSQHVWVKDITARHFAYAAVSTYDTSKWVTVEDAYYLDPISTIDGGRRYAFNFDGQLGLVKDVVSQKGRHDFVVGSTVPGPNVFLDSQASGSSNDSGPHHRWSTGVLLDNVKVPSNYITVRNRGNSGTGHGWAGANSVVWNSQARGFIVENPPTAQNWLIGSVGPDAKNTLNKTKASEKGIKDSPGNNVQPRSLYYAQLQERLARPGLEHREYWLGDIDGVKRDSAVDDVFLDLDWLAEVRTQAPKVQSFDQTSKGSWVPFTYQFQLDPSEEVVAATLSLGVKASQSVYSDNRLYIDSLGTSVQVSQLGWDKVTTSAVTGVVVDLTNYLAQLQDGRLNLALSDDLLIDWSALNIQVAPKMVAEPDYVLYADSDVTIRAGGPTSTTETTLGVQGSPASEQREALLKFDISQIAGPIDHAVVRLTIASASPAVENGASQVKTAWVEDAVSFASKPASSTPFVSWVAKPGKTIEFAVTPQLQRLLEEGATTLSLRIVTTNGNGLVTYGASEGDSAAAPQLLVYSSAAAIIEQPAETVLSEIDTPPQPVVNPDPGVELAAEGESSSAEALAPSATEPPATTAPTTSSAASPSSTGANPTSKLTSSRFRSLVKSLTRRK
jgi:hypothetical protein